MEDKTEYQQLWEERIQQIEVAISERLILGVSPDTMIATTQTLEELCSHLGVEPDWRNPEGRAIAFGDNGEVVLRIYRCLDLPYGNIIIR